MSLPQRIPDHAWEEWVEAHLGPVKRSGDGSITARCPLHEDRTPSLRIWIEGQDRAPGFHCFGCGSSGTLSTLAQEAGWTPPGTLGPRPVSALPARRKARPKPAEKKARLITRAPSFIYQAQDGSPVHAVWRRLPQDGPGSKVLYTGIPGPDGSWQTGSAPLVPPYRLPELLEDQEPVWWVEGERDAETVRGLGLHGSTSAGGASGLSRLDAESLVLLAGRTVYVIPDLDEPGAAYAQAVREMLERAGARTCLVDLSDHWPTERTEPAEQKDLTDWVRDGGTRQSLLDASRASLPAPSEDRLRSETVRARILEAFPAEPAQTDHGNALLLRAACEGSLLWVREPGQDLDRGRPMVWDGSRFIPSQEIAYQWARSAVEFRAGLWPSSEKWARTSQSRRALRDSLALCSTLPGMSLSSVEMDANTRLLNVLNGTLDTRTGELRPHSRADRLTRQAPVRFVPGARAPVWEAFLDQIFCGDALLVEWVQRLCGYCLSGAGSEQIFCLLHGSGANGKTVFLNALEEMLGDYSGTIPTGILTQRRGLDGAAPSPDLVKLRSVRLARCSEEDHGRRFSEAEIKRLTGSASSITARALYSEPVRFRLTALLAMETNALPECSGTDEGFWRRIRVIPFLLRLSERERDSSLQDRLREEMDGIFWWAVLGLRAWLERGLRDVPEAVTEASEAYRSESDLLEEFLSERTEWDPDSSLRSSDLLHAFNAWAQDRAGLPITPRVLKNRLELYADRLEARDGSRRLRLTRSNGSRWTGLRFI